LPQYLRDRYDPYPKRQCGDLRQSHNDYNAREVIQIIAKGYGWDKWVKVRENVQLAKPPAAN
jgi:hypothetical protein